MKLSFHKGEQDASTVFVKRSCVVPVRLMEIRANGSGLRNTSLLMRSTKRISYES